MANLNEKTRLGGAGFGGYHVAGFNYDETENTFQIQRVKDAEAERIDIHAAAFSNWLWKCGKTPAEWLKRPFTEQARALLQYLDERGAALERRYLRIFEDN